MSTIRNIIGMALLVSAACYSQDQASAQPAYPQQPNYYAGPPGGGMDPSYGDPGQQAPQDPTTQYPQYPQYPQDPGMDPNAPVDPSSAAPMDPSAYAGVDPTQPEATQDPNGAMGPVNDSEIDATLDGYGQWVDEPDYGRVWRPDATVVGVDFTPYETCGTWVETEYGPTFNCDYSWGWLPFHYGRWGWMGGYWGWVPGHQWGPAWVDWRHGGGYVGWRPMGPEVRDHRHAENDRNSHWRFASEGDFGKPHIRSHLFNNPAEGLRVTQPSTRPPLRGNAGPVRAATLMHGRQSPIAGGRRPEVTRPTPQRIENPSWHQQQPQTFRQPQQTWRQPQQQTWRQPQQQTWRQPQQSYRPPQQTYRPAPYRGSSGTHFSAPSHSYSAPSHSYSAPSHSYSAPSHSFGGGGHSSGGGGGHSSGGGHHR